MIPSSAFHQSPLWTAIRRARMRTLAVMGMSKNTGKTVTLNHLLAQAQATATTIGITSIGRDGEERDQVFSIPKPPVRVHPGVLVATARDTLLRSRIHFRELAGTGIGTPLGEVIIVKMLGAGEMEVAGASRSADQQRVITLLRHCGAELTILDGALGRSHHASPAIADGVVLATGASVNGGGGGIADVIRKTRDRLAILNIPEADPVLAARVRPTIEAGAVGVWNREGEPLFNARISTLNAAPTLHSLPAAEIGLIAVSGAVGRALWQAVSDLLKASAGLTLVVADGTRLFVDATDLAAFARSGGHVLALSGIRMAGITLNPFSPFGGSFAADEFLAAARDAFPGQLVCDVVLEAEAARSIQYASQQGVPA